MKLLKQILLSSKEGLFMLSTPSMNFPSGTYDPGMEDLCGWLPGPGQDRTTFRHALWASTGLHKAVLDGCHHDAEPFRHVFDTGHYLYNKAGSAYRDRCVTGFIMHTCEVCAWWKAYVSDYNKSMSDYTCINNAYTGTANGGSAILWAGIMELAGLEPSKIITIDVDSPDWKATQWGGKVGQYKDELFSSLCSKC